MLQLLERFCVTGFTQAANSVVHAFDNRLYRLVDQLTRSSGVFFGFKRANGLRFAIESDLGAPFLEFVYERNSGIAVFAGSCVTSLQPRCA